MSEANSVPHDTAAADVALAVAAPQKVVEPISGADAVQQISKFVYCYCDIHQVSILC